ncbi:MAG: OmpP1/FadL family transporter [Oligoflexia bacterium]
MNPHCLKRFIAPAALLALWIGWGAPASANLGDTGFGSHSTALAGTGVSWSQGGFSAYSNPAALALIPSRKLELNYGWTLMDPSFTPIRGVTLENSYTTDRTSATERVGDVSDNYRSTFGQILGAAFAIAPDSYGLSGGITLYSPFDQLGFADTGETFIPEYVLYRARTQRPQLELGIGAKLSERFHLGLGVHVGFGLTSNATVFLQARDGKPSTMRVTASAKPKASPVLGWLWAGDTWTLGQAVRLANSAHSELSLTSSARAFGDLAALDIQLSALSALYYDPLSIETGASFQYTDSRRLILQIDVQGWRSFKQPAIAIGEPQNDCEIGSGSSNCANLVVSRGILPNYPLRNIVIPRVAHEWNLESTQLRAGYAFRPGIFSAPPSQNGNYLDPSRHMFSFGAGFKLIHLFGIATPVLLDTHLLFHQMVSEQVTKSPNTEAGEAGTKIGSPGYSAGGRVWGGGVSITVAI